MLTQNISLEMVSKLHSYCARQHTSRCIKQAWLLQNVEMLSSALALFCLQTVRTVIIDGNTMDNSRKYWTVNVKEQNKLKNPISLCEIQFTLCVKHSKFRVFNLTLRAVNERNTCLQISLVTAWNIWIFLYMYVER